MAINLRKNQEDLKKFSLLNLLKKNLATGEANHSEESAERIVETDSGR